MSPHHFFARKLTSAVSAGRFTNRQLQLPRVIPKFNFIAMGDRKQVLKQKSHQLVAFLINNPSSALAENVS